MKIIITGGTGFIGNALVSHYLDKNYQCVVIGRDTKKIKKIFGDAVKGLTWSQLQKEGLHEIKTADVIINLVGANIGEKRWTEKRKAELLESRIIPTRAIAELCAALGENSPALLSADGVGIYGLQQQMGSPMDEQTSIPFSHPGSFLEKIGQEWEAATLPAKNANVRVVNMRFGVVLGKDGGVLQKLKIPFLFGLGGPIGTGEQPFSWIALTDLVNAIDFVFGHSEIYGAVNFVAPQVVTQKEFAYALGKALHRPSFLPMPGFLLQLLYGEMAKELLLSGQNVRSRVLLEHGFQFQFSAIDSALAAIV